VRLAAAYTAGFSLKEAKTYLDAHKAQDPYKACGKNLLLYDGWPDIMLQGNGQKPVEIVCTRREVVPDKTLAD